MNNHLKEYCFSYVQNILDFINFEKDKYSIIFDSIQSSLENDFNKKLDPSLNHLVDNGFPFDFSYRFPRNDIDQIRFALEPMAFLDLYSRLDQIQTRFLNILKLNKMESLNDDFYNIFSIITQKNKNQNINWFCHFGFVYSNNLRDIFKIYFAPFPPTILKEIKGQKSILNKENFMDKLVDCQLTAKERFIKLLESYKMEKEISHFKKIYKILLGNDDLKDKGAFITFIGVDFNREQEPSFKVYFNPNIRKIK